MSNEANLKPGVTKRKAAVDNDIPGLYTQTHHGIDFDTTDYASTQYLFKNVQWEKSSSLAPSTQKLIPEREEWSSKWELRACLFAIAVGLGNIWKFSSTLLSMVNDKSTRIGPFLVAYGISWLLIGFPIVILELFLGFLCSRSIMASWKCVPILKGVGFGQIIVSIYLCAVHASIITWTITIVMSTSFTWKDFQTDILNESQDITKESLNAVITDWNMSTEFLRQYVYDTTQPLGDIPEMNWLPVVVLTVAILITLLITFTGIHVFGKLLGCISLGLLAALVGFFVIAVIDNSHFFQNISNLLQESCWLELMESQIWFTAVAQVLFITMGGSGCLISIGSFGSRNIPLISTAMFFSCLSIVISVLCALLMLGSVGPELPSVLQRPSAILAEPDLALISWHVQLSNLDRESVLWINIGFVVIALSGLGCCVVLLNSLFTFIHDCPSVTNQRRYLWRGIITLIIFIVALPCIMQCGLNVLNLICTYGINPLLIVCAMIQCTAICWIYGPHKYKVDLMFITSETSIVRAIAFLTMLAPIFMMALLIWSATQITIPILPEPPFPWWVDVLGIVLIGVGALCIIITGVLVICKQDDYGIKEMFQSAVKPTIEWGPPDPLVRNEWLNWKTERFLMGRNPVRNDSPTGSLASIEMRSTRTGEGHDNSTLQMEDF